MEATGDRVLIGTLRNNTDRSNHQVQLVISFFSEADVVLSEMVESARDLGAGETWSSPDSSDWEIKRSGFLDYQGDVQ
jgi:hypothetical protein